MFSIQELIDIIVMTLALGYIFKDTFKPVYGNMQFSLQQFSWHDIGYAALITAPGIILHELGHKLVGLIYGLQPVFHAAYGWLTLGVVLKMLNFGFIFFVPGYVSHVGGATLFQSTAISFAGPGVNLVLWLVAKQLFKHKVGKEKWHNVWVLTAKINMFLFIFNMLPIPPFDGFNVWTGLFKLIF
jgi:Zn-dependent protease